MFLQGCTINTRRFLYVAYKKLVLNTNNRKTKVEETKKDYECYHSNCSSLSLFWCNFFIFPYQISWFTSSSNFAYGLIVENEFIPIFKCSVLTYFMTKSTKETVRSYDLLKAFVLFLSHEFLKSCCVLEFRFF